MLFYETIDTSTLELLKKLQAIPALTQMRLVGGTSLALQMGHRKSIDIDLFGKIEADELTLLEALQNICQPTILKRSENIKIYLLNAIKTDIVNYPYPWLYEPVIEEALRLADIRDIAAMKLSAITNRGTKKDFVDLFFLLQKFSMEELLGFYRDKYSDGSVFLVLRSLSYFADADADEDPNMLTAIDWNEVKNNISKAVNSYSRTLSQHRQ